jgi:hypothetical protein
MILGPGLVGLKVCGLVAAASGTDGIGAVTIVPLLVCRR